jgi:hypothetical protein
MINRRHSDWYVCVCVCVYTYTGLHTGWFEALVKYLSRLLGRSSGAENVNNFSFSDLPPFLSDDVFTLMSLCLIVIVWRGLRAESSWKYRQLKRSYQIRTVVPGTSLTSSHHTNRKVGTHKEVLWSDDWKILQRAEFAYFFLSFFHWKQGNQFTCCVESKCFHFAKNLHQRKIVVN